jgi:membrane dipeptidase
MADGWFTSPLPAKTYVYGTKLFALSLLLACLASVALAQKTSSSATKSAVSSRAAAVHNSAIVIDTHADTPGRFVDENFDIGSDAGRGHIDLDKIKKGNLGAEFFSIWVDPEKYKGGYAHRAFDMIDSVHEQVRRHPQDMVMAYSAEDIARALALTNGSQP